MEESVNKKKVDYVLILIVGLFILSIISFVAVVGKLASVQKDAAGNYVDSDQDLVLSDPFSIPLVQTARLVSSNDTTVVFEVDGTVQEVMARYQLKLIDNGSWQIVEASIEPSALDYQEIIIRNGDETNPNLLLSVETLDETKVRVKVAQI
jgi:hypothetical protein